MKGAIDLNKHIEDIMIGKDKIFSLKLKKKLSNRSARRICKAGFSRIPVYAKGDHNFVVGLLLIKSLIGLDLSEEPSIEDLVRDEHVTLRQPIFAHPDEEIGSLLMKFKNGRSHMAIITDDPEGMQDNMQSLYDDDSLIMDEDEKRGSVHHSKEQPEILGIVTIEDILEEIINDEIFDEADYDKNNNADVFKIDISVDKSIIEEEKKA